MAKKTTKTKAPSKDKAAKPAAIKTSRKPTKAKPAAAIPNGTATKPRKSRAAGVASPVPMITITVTHDQIAARAYEVWQRNGCVPGRDYENWKQAEAELLAELNA